MLVGRASVQWGGPLCWWDGPPCWWDGPPCPSIEVIPESAVGGYPGSRLRQSCQRLVPSLHYCLLPAASCISLCLKLPTESITFSLSRISRLGPFSPNFTSNPACAISRFQNPEIRGQTTEVRKKLLNRRQTRTNTDRHSPADFLFFGTRVPHGGTHGYSRIKDGSAKNAKKREDEDRLKASRMAGVPIRSYRGKWGTLKDKNKPAYF